MLIGQYLQMCKQSQIEQFLAVGPILVYWQDILISNAYDIHLGQDEGCDKNLHPPNISWIHDVNKTCFLHVTK